MWTSALASIFGSVNKENRSLRQSQRRIQIEALEERVLLDAAGLNTAPVLDLSALKYDAQSGYYSIDITSGAPWQAALSATDADGDDIYFSVTPEDTTLLSAAVSSGKKANVTAQSNPYWKLSVTWTDSSGVKQSGTMIFELLKDQAPTAVNRIIEATGAGFYNNTIFDYLNKDNLIYGGSFNSSDNYIAENYSTVDDSFSSTLRHTSKGLLGMIPADLTLYGNDTCTTQFYITSSPQTSLDYNLSIFGNLISGYDVLDSLNSVSTGTHNVVFGDKTYQYKDWPTNPITILSAEIVDGNAYAENSSGATTAGTTVTLKSSLKVTTENAYTTYMNVTAVDSNGNASESMKIKVNISAANTTNVPPYITSLNVKEIKINSTPTGSKVDYANGIISAADANGDAFYYWFGLYAQGSETLLSNYYGYNETSGYFEVYSHAENKITGAELSPGVYNLYVVVASGKEEADWNSGDSQMIPVYILPQVPTEVELTSSSYNDGESDGTTSKTSDLIFHTTGATVGCTVEVWTKIAGTDTLLGSAVCTNSDGTADVVMTSGKSLISGSYDITVKQVLTKDVSVGNTQIKDKRLESAVLSGYTITINDLGNLNAPVILDPFFTTPSWEGGKASALENGTAYAFEDELFTLSLRATDADDDTVTWSIVSAKNASQDISSLLTLTATDELGGAALTWTPGEDFGGSEFTIVLQASDGRGKVTNLEVKLYVNEVQDNPVFLDTNNQAGIAGQWIWFSVKAHDPDPTNAQTTIAPIVTPDGFNTSTLLYRSTNIYSDNGKEYLYTQYEVILKIPETASAGDAYNFTFKASKTVSGSTLWSTKDVSVYVLDNAAYQAMLNQTAPSLEYVASSGLTADQTLETANNNSSAGKTLAFLGHGLTAGSPACLFSDGDIIGVEKEVVVADRVINSTYGWKISDGEHKITIAQPTAVTMTTSSGVITVDIMGASSNQLTISVDATAPVLAETLSNNSVTEGVEFTATASAADSHAITYSLENPPVGMTINASTGAIVWTPDFSQGEVNSITVKATDSLGNYSTKTYALIIAAAPDLIIENQVIDEFEAWTLELNAENATNYTLLSGPEGLTLNAPKTEGEKWYLAWTPTEEQGGADPYTVQISVANDAGAVRTVSFTITVNELNQPPVLGTISDKTVKEGSAVSVIVSATDADLPAQNLTWSLLNAPDGMTIKPQSGNPNKAVINWTPTEQQGGNVYTVSVVVSDGMDSVSQNVVFTVEEVDDAPVFQTPEMPVIFSGKPGYITAENSVSISFTATDPDLPANTIVYSIVGDNAYGAAIDSSTGEFVWTPANNTVSGAYEFTVRATEDSTSALYTEYTFTVTVVDKIAITTTPVSAGKEHALWSYSPQTNLEGINWRAVNWSVSGAPTGLTFDSRTGAISWTPGEADGGQSFTFTLTASDQAGEVAQSITLAVEEVDDAPVFQTPTVPTAFAGQPGSFLRSVAMSISFSATDPDFPVNTIVYSITGDNAYGAAIDSSTGLFTWAPSESVPAGTYQFTIRATENSEAGAYSEYTVSLTLVEELILNPINAAEFSEGQAGAINPSTNADGVSWRPLSWSVTGAPEGVSINTQTGLITWTPSETQGGTEYTFTVNVTDGQTLVSQDVVVSVLEIDEAPVFDSSSVPAENFIPPGSSIVMNFAAVDPDIPANAIEYSIIESPPDAVIDAQTGQMKWRAPQNARPGEYSVIVRATEMKSIGGKITAGLYTDYHVHLTVMSSLPPDTIRPTSPFDRLELPQLTVELSRDMLYDIALNAPSSPFNASILNGDQLEFHRGYDSNSTIFGIHLGANSRSLGEIKPADKDAEEKSKDEKDSTDTPEKTEQTINGQQVKKGKPSVGKPKTKK